MLSRTQRLTSGDALRRTVRSGVRAGSSSVVLHWRPGGEPLRVGFIVSKAVGSAVDRNRVKRRLRHVVAGAWAALPPAGELVVRAQPSAQGTPSAVLAADVIGCAERLRARAAA